MYRGDQPIKQCSEDKLGRKLFSKELAKSILNLSTTDTFTIGLYGKWGSGKTSVINMTIQELNNISENTAEDKKPIIIQFNPWNYSDSDQLIYQFFSTLSKNLKIQKHDLRLGNIGTSILDGIKKSIVTELEKQKRKIIVIIDDIDRLSNEQIKLIFN